MREPVPFNLMFYGRGAGKLPTGSAVVSDMVNAALAAGRTLPVGWSEETRQPLPHGDTLSRFFVRTPGAEKEKAKEAFAGLIEEEWQAEGICDEFAFVTKEMKESAFEERASQAALLGRIRML